MEPRYRPGKLSTDEQQAITSHFGVRSIPILIAFKNGRIVARKAETMDTHGLVR